jgi:catechol 2,3-dioxygenase-like lactoylglutathione lyase family enzyme
MFAHISLGVNDLGKSVAFYDAVMKTLGHSRLFGDEQEEFMAYGPEEGFFIINTPLNPERGLPKFCNGTHVCFRAKSRDQVDQFYAVSLEHGATCDGKPGIREHYSPKYYAAYVLDIDGHKLEAVFSN